MKNLDMLQTARNFAAALLSGRMYTCKELFDRLIRKGVEEPIAEQVVGEFVRAGYLDDRRFAELYIADAVNLGAKGMFRIRQELFRKGISGCILDEAFAETEADSGAALDAYVRQRNLCDDIHSRKDLEKLKARLARRGYSMKEINQCLAGYSFHFEESDWQTR